MVSLFFFIVKRYQKGVNIFRFILLMIDLRVNKRSIFMDKAKKGQQRFKEVMGEKALEDLKNLEHISPDLSKYIIEFCYGDLFAREVLTDKTREVAIVGCLIGQGNTGLPLRNHLRGMLNVGWTPQEIIEVLILLIGYKGFPSVVEAMGVLQDILNDA